MRLSVIGCGYLGTVHAAAMAELGHEVIGIDVDPRRIDLLRAANPPFFEPGLSEILSSAMASGRLKFSTEIAQVEGSAVHFLAVGTPQEENGIAADMRFVDSAVAGLLPYLAPGQVVVGKSTVPVGTAAKLALAVNATGAKLAWNPEFLREGFAVQDTLRPDRLVYGVAPADETVVDVLNAVYADALGAGTPLVITDYATAELVKVAANAFLATKISFINAMAEIADATDADVTQLADAIGFDSRIGRQFLNAGIGFGGGCLPKDIRAFVARADELGVGESLKFLREVDTINLRRRQHVANLVIDALGMPVAGKKVALLGLAFKPNSDDVRDSPALDVAAALHARGIRVVATDPHAIENARRLHPELEYAASVDEALKDADVVVLVTEWLSFKELNPGEIHDLVRRPIIIDARNVLDPKTWRASGWTFKSLGRG